jgi:hypothetical protein
VEESPQIALATLELVLGWGHWKYSEMQAVVELEGWQMWGLVELVGRMDQWRCVDHELVLKNSCLRVKKEEWTLGKLEYAVDRSDAVKNVVTRGGL